MTLTLVYLVMNIVRTYAIYDFIENSLSKRKISNKILFVVYIGYYILISFLFLKVGSPAWIISANLIIGFLITLLYKSTLWRQLLVAVFIYILSMASEDLVFSIMSIFMWFLPSTLLTPTAFSMIGITTSMLFLLVLVKLVKPLFHYQDIPLPRFYWIALFLIPLSSICHQYLLQRSLDKHMEALLIPAAGSAVLLLFINILVFYLYNQLMKEEQTKYENMLLSQQNDAYEKQALLIHDFRQVTQTQRHDMNNHLSALLELCQQSGSQEIQQYLRTLLDQSTSKESGISSGNSIVDAMVNSKLYLASQQNTPIHMKLQLQNDLSINRVDLTVILGNLLDNALEACLKLPQEQRSIWLRITSKHQVLTIETKNTYLTSELKFQNENIITTKSDPSTHGIGLRNIRQVVEKYDGTATFTQTTENNQTMFLAQLLLYLPQR